MRSLRRIPVLALLPVLFVLLWQLSVPAMAGGQTPLMTSDEKHYAKGLEPTLRLRKTAKPGAEAVANSRRATRPVNTVRGSRLLYEKAEKRERDLDFDKRLSRLCRQGLFAQRRDRLFIARIGGMVYGAGVGGHWSLIDPGNNARPAFLYLIQNQGTGRCRVYRGAYLEGKILPAYPGYL